MSDADRPSGFFRCPVQREQSRATIRVGRVRVPAVLQETSIDGFTLTVAPKYAARLRLGRPWLLKTASEKSEVHPEWMFHAPAGEIQLGVRRLRDVTPADESRRGWRFGFAGGRRGMQSNTPEIVLAAVIGTLVVVLTLPGLGDHLGTAPRIRAAVEGVVTQLTLIVRQIL